MPGFKGDQKIGQGYAYRNHNMLMLPDFPQPDFYKKMFKEWGLEDY